MRAAAIAFAGILLVGCGTQGPTPQAGRTPHPAPSGATALVPAIAPAAPLLPSGGFYACDQALLDPVRIAASGGAITFVRVSTGLAITVVWPSGFAARLVNGRAEILAPDGTVIGSAGDGLSELGGGLMNTGSDAFGVCSVGAEQYPEAPQVLGARIR